MELTDALQQVELVVGTVTEAGPHPGARAPSYLLRIDFGGRGEREATVEAGDYDAEQLEGAQVVCAVHGDEVLVLAARSHAHGIVLVHPARTVEPGTVVS